MSKSKRAAAALASLCALMALVGCDAFGAKEETTPSTSGAVTVLSDNSTIEIESTNLGDTLGELVTIDPAGLASSSDIYLPVLRSELYAGTAPFISFTFDRAITSIFSPTTSIDGNGDTVSLYVRNVSDSAVILLTDPAPAVSGNTVRFNLPSIATHEALPGDTENDNETFQIGKRYMVDFFVKTVDGLIGRVTVGFIPVNAPVALGAFDDSDLMLYANTAEGQAHYSLYQIDSTQVFYLLGAQPATHTDDAKAAEAVRSGTTTYTTFGDYNSRMGATQTHDANGIFSSLDALDNGTMSRTTRYVALYWEKVENATEYSVYTTDVDGNEWSWEYVESFNPNDNTDPHYTAENYVVYDFDLSAYPITGYRAVRIVPKNNNQIDNTPAEIRIADTVRPASDIPATKTVGAFSITNNYGMTHDTTVAHTNGHIEQITGSLDLNLTAAERVTVTDEAYEIRNISNGLSVTIPQANQDAGCAILPLTADDVTAFLGNSLPATSKVFTVGTNLIGVLSATNQLTVYAHLACYYDGTGPNVDYNGTTVTGTFTVTYADMSRNLMVTPMSSNGLVTYTEQ